MVKSRNQRIYDDDLAYIHDAGFGELAHSAAIAILDLGRQNPTFLGQFPLLTAPVPQGRLLTEQLSAHLMWRSTIRGWKPRSRSSCALPLTSNERAKNLRFCARGYLLT
jgi:hypothetical protein